MTATPNQPPRHNRRFRDHDKLQRGKAWFSTLVNGLCKLEELKDDEVSDALYYASDSVTGATGTNRVRKAIRNEAKKRGLSIK